MKRSILITLLLLTSLSKISAQEDSIVLFKERYNPLTTVYFEPVHSLLSIVKFSVETPRKTRITYQPGIRYEHYTESDDITESFRSVTTELLGKLYTNDKISYNNFYVAGGAYLRNVEFRTTERTWETVVVNGTPTTQLVDSDEIHSVWQTGIKFQVGMVVILSKYVSIDTYAGFFTRANLDNDEYAISTSAGPGITSGYVSGKFNRLGTIPEAGLRIGVGF